MAHSRLNQNAMFDWIKRCLAAGERLPSDAEIMGRFVFESPEQARTLLSDLADQGRITIQWGAGGRVITLGRGKSSFAAARPIAASIVKRSSSVDRVAIDPDAVLAKPHGPHAGAKRPGGVAADAAKLADALARRRGISINSSPARRVEVTAASEGEQPAAEQARVQSAPPMLSPPRPEPTGEEPGTTDTTNRLRVRSTPEGRADTSEQASDRQVGASPAVNFNPAMVRLPTAPGRKKGPATKFADPFNVRLTPEDLAALQRAAEAAGGTTGSHARTLIVAGLTGVADPEPPAFERGRKPFISAARIRAARAAGKPLDVFVTALIERGLTAHLADRPAVRAA